MCGVLRFTSVKLKNGGAEKSWFPRGDLLQNLLGSVVGFDQGRFLEPPGVLFWGLVGVVFLLLFCFRFCS